MTKRARRLGLAASPPRDTAMPLLPTRFAGIILAFALLFVQRSWRHAQVLLVGAILAPGGARWRACCASPGTPASGAS